MSNVCRYCRHHYGSNASSYEDYCSSSCFFAAADSNKREKKDEKQEKERLARTIEKNMLDGRIYSNGSFFWMLLLSGGVWWFIALNLPFPIPNHLGFFWLLSLFIVPIAIAAWCDQRQ